MSAPLRPPLWWRFGLGLIEFVVALVATLGPIALGIAVIVLAAEVQPPFRAVLEYVGLSVVVLSGLWVGIARFSRMPSSPLEVVLAPWFARQKARAYERWMERHGGAAPEER